MSQLIDYRDKPKSGMPKDGIFILVGNPKSGKSTFAASFPNSYVLELEKGGADRIPGRIHDIKDLTTFRLVLKDVFAEPSIKTVIIDTIDVLSDWIEDEIAKAKGLESITERKVGVDGFALWGEYRKKIEGLVNYLQASNKLIILVAHCKEPKMDSDSNLITPAGINMPGKSGGFLAAQAELIGYSYRKTLGSGTAYYLTFAGGPLGAWGSRVDELNDKTIQLSKQNPYTNFEAIFKTEAPKSQDKKTKEKKK